MVEKGKFKALLGRMGKDNICEKCSKFSISPISCVKVV